MVLSTRFLSVLHIGAIRSFRGPSPVIRWMTILGGSLSIQSTIKSQYSSSEKRGKGSFSYNSASFVFLRTCKSCSFIPKILLFAAKSTDSSIISFVSPGSPKIRWAITLILRLFNSLQTTVKSLTFV